MKIENGSWIMLWRLKEELFITLQSRQFIRCTRTKIVYIEFIFLHDLSLHMLSHIVIVFHLKVHEKYCIICLWYVITEIAMSKEADNIYVLWEIYLLSHCSFWWKTAFLLSFTSQLLLTCHSRKYLLYCYYSRWNSEGMQLKRKSSLR